MSTEGKPPSSNYKRKPSEDTNFDSINVTNTIKGKSLKIPNTYILDSTYIPTYKTPKFGKKT